MRLSDGSSYVCSSDLDPERALHAAFEIRDAVGSLGPGLQVRTGVCTGEVIADPAARDRGEFMVTGAPVHRAQRLQAAARSEARRGGIACVSTFRSRW